MDLENKLIINNESSDSNNDFESVIINEEIIQQITLSNTEYNKYISDDINQTNNYYINIISILIFINKLIVLGLFICYLLFSILSLYYVSYHEQKNECKNSNLWINTLLNIISYCVLLNIYFTHKYYYIKIITILIHLSIFIWSFIELYFINCINNLNNTDLYLILQLNTFLGIIFIFKSIFYILFKLYNSD